MSSPGSSEHATGGMLSWQNFSGSWWVQMGYLRGNMPGWTDNLPSGYAAAYVEFQDTQGNYQFAPFQAVPFYEKHTFTMTQDGSGHYYDFYFDGVLEWANVYISEAPTVVLDGNEDYNLDSVCESVYSDNNGFSLALGEASRIHIDPGHAVGTAGSTGPWTSDGDTYVGQLPGLGYACGQNSNGYYWWCG